MTRRWLRVMISILAVAQVATAIVSMPQRSLADASYATASPAPTSSATVSPVPNGDKVVADRAREWFARLARGDVDRAQLTKEMNDALPQDKVAQLSAALKPLGEPRSFALIDKTQQGKFTVYRYHVDVTGGAIVFTFVLDPQAMIAGLFITNA